MFGSIEFPLLYLVAGLAGSVASLFWNSTLVSAGASGAVFGVYGALLDALLPQFGSIPQQEVFAPPADLIFFPQGTNSYERNRKELPNHVGILLDTTSWIGSQSSTSVAVVNMTNP